MTAGWPARTQARRLILGAELWPTTLLAVPGMPGIRLHGVDNKTPYQATTTTPH